MLHYNEFRAMNTSVILAAEGKVADLAEGFQRTEEQVRAYEQRFTRFSEDSELSALNRSAGTTFQASEDLFEVVRLALEYYRATNGLFNPGVLGALEKAGYDRSFDELRATSSARVFAAPLPSPCPDFGNLELDILRGTIRLPQGVRVDLGGIAKGWIAERAAEYLHTWARACAVNAGGDQYACGVPEGETGWTVAMEDPFDSSRDAAILNVPPGAIATSTITRRRWVSDGVERHHLIDPRTGQPAKTPWVSVTVNAESAALSEVLAKSFLIGGPEIAPRLLSRFPEAAVITVDTNRKLWGSPYGQRLLATRVYG